MTPPLRFCFGLHLHQPVGNFDSVFTQHLDDVYAPLLDALTRGEGWPVALHISGPLLEWLEAHAAPFLDRVGRGVADGRIELLAAGHDEPILAVLPRDDRQEQIARHRAWLHRRFGADATGLWLTERVWEPTLAEDLALAGIRFALVDDRHFLVSGTPRGALHAHHLTESGGHRLALFPIDERLRYLVPFRPPYELAEYFRTLRAAGHRLAILADDGEKFGGWPGTKKWVYEDGWMERFLETLRDLRDTGEAVLSRFDEALTATPSAGLAYLPSASYREMEAWSLPPAPARALLRLERDWGTARLAGPDGALLRGGHWRGFLAKYPESNRMHKTMLALSALCRERGDPADARRAIGRAQCNDAYWHGVFGGLYLPFLRGALWRELARAEALLRAGQPLAVDLLDLDADGRHELWVHSAARSLVVAPARGGMVEQWLEFGAEANLLNVIARHREAYHEPLDGAADGHAPADDAGAPSIHDLETELTELPPVDLEPRGLFVDRILDEDATREDFVAGTLRARHSWAARPMAESWIAHGAGLEIVLSDASLRKVLRLAADGALSAEWSWDPATTGWFSTELSFSAPFAIEAPDADRWDYPVETVAKSEKGFDRMIQGSAVVLRWPASAGRAAVTLRPAPAAD